MKKGMKGTDGLSGLPEDPGHCTQDLVRLRIMENKEKELPPLGLIVWLYYECTQIYW
jgi:hypothetical protein